MSNEKQETIADIEAAAKREREATREKSSQVGNSAKMREALEAIKDTLDERRVNGEMMEYWQYSELFDIANTALSAPPRNYDVGTVAEQEKRMNEFCNLHKHGGSVYACENCEFFTVDRCELAWSQMQYEEVKK